MYEYTYPKTQKHTRTHTHTHIYIIYKSHKMTHLERHPLPLQQQQLIGAFEGVEVVGREEDGFVVQHAADAVLQDVLGHLCRNNIEICVCVCVLMCVMMICVCGCWICGCMCRCSAPGCVGPPL
jgi:hypothetical protein